MTDYLSQCPAPRWGCYEAEPQAGEEAGILELILEEGCRKPAGSKWPSADQENNPSI